MVDVMIKPTILKQTTARNTGERVMSLSKLPPKAVRMLRKVVTDGTASFW